MFLELSYFVSIGYVICFRVKYRIILKNKFKIETGYNLYKKKLYKSL